MPPEFGPPELVDLAADYLARVDATNSGANDPEERLHAAAERTVVHDQILAALRLTRDDPFDIVAWAKATVAATEQQAPPFDTNQPLEVYRRHHAIRLAAFAAFLGISEDDYLALVAGDAKRAATLGHQVAQHLNTLPWLITEIAPDPDEEELDEIFASIEEGEEQGYWRVDKDTGEMEGPVLLGPELPQPAAPNQHLQLAGALARLIAIHASGDDPDYAALRSYLEGRIRSALELGSGERFDAEAWADDILEGDISLLRQRNANS